MPRDPGPPGSGIDAAASWERRGVAQAHFAHGWPARSARVLRQEAPELAPLVDEGAGQPPTVDLPRSEFDHIVTA